MVSRLTSKNVCNVIALSCLCNLKDSLICRKEVLQRVINSVDINSVDYVLFEDIHCYESLNSEIANLPVKSGILRKSTISDNSSLVAPYEYKKIKIFEKKSLLENEIDANGALDIDHLTCEIVNEDIRQISDFNLFDSHVHTNYAYCSKNTITIEEIIKRKGLTNTHMIGIAEHAAQLYLPRSDYSSGIFVDDPSLLDYYKTSKFYRMGKFREEMFKFKSQTVKIGLEIEVDHLGKFSILPEDLIGWDFLLGAVHYIPQKYALDPVEGFVWTTTKLLEQGIDILAHPFRFFIRNNLEIPKHLYSFLARQLKKYNTAVELNFHTNTPEAEFFKECLKNKVKIALGSDSHDLYEIGCSKRYDDFLASIGATSSNLYRL